MLNEADFQEWAQAYARWHAADYVSWREHLIQTLPALKGIPLGKLTEDEIDKKIKPFVSKLAGKYKQVKAQPGQRTQQEMQFIADYGYSQYAIAHLDHYRKEKAGATPAAPAPPKAKIDLQIAEETSEALAPVNNNGELVGADMVLSFLRTQRQELLNHSKDLDQLAKEIKKAKEIERLAKLAGDIGESKEIAIEASAWECDARFEVSRIINLRREEGEMSEAGRAGKRSGTPLNKVLPEKTDRNWNAILSPLTPEEYQQRLKSGLEEKTLSKKTFSLKKPKSPSKGSSKQSFVDPHQHLINFLCDVRDNPSYYPIEGEEGITSWTELPKFVQNFPRATALRAILFLKHAQEKLHPKPEPAAEPAQSEPFP